MAQAEDLQELHQLHQNYELLERVATREEDKESFKYGKELVAFLILLAGGTAIYN